jgi:TRAP-type mannitol/chloroaromatic compound transport system permease small subunit
MINQLEKLIAFFSEKVGIISSFLVLLLIILVTVSVILRYVFSIGFIWLQDLYIWIHAIFILLGIAFTVKNDGHVRIDLFYRSFRERKKKIVNLLGTIFFGLPLTFLLIFNGLNYFLRSYNLNESSKESGGLPNIFILKFFILFLGIMLLLEFTRQILIFLKKND